MKLYHLLWLLAALALTRPAAAQGTASSGQAPPTVTSGQRQAATALLNTIYSDESFSQLIEQMLEAQLKVHPEVKPYESEMRAFFRKYMSWSSMQADMVDIYAQEFTEAELRDIMRFYESPVGRKSAAKMPVLMQKGMELGQRRVQEHLPELQQAIANKAGK